MKTIVLRWKDVKVYDRFDCVDGEWEGTSVVNFKGREYSIISEYTENDSYTVYQTRVGRFIDDNGAWFFQGRPF